MLSLKHQQFVNEYLKCWNATEAYQRVYQRASYDTARANAATLLADTNISEVIRKRIEENAMSADEVLKRLGEQARGSIGDFVSIKDGLPFVDFSLAQDKIHLVKKLKTKTKTYTLKGDEDKSITETDVEFELYDAQSALVHLGKHHGLFVDKQEVTGANGEPMRMRVEYVNNWRASSDENN